MRGNRIKQKLQAGEIAVAVSGHSQSADTVDFCGPLGFDGYWLEGEHGPVTWERIGDLSRACDLWGISSLMRIHSHEPGLITRTLDCGVNGLVIPHVNSRAEAEAIVQAARFAPLGKRGMFQGRRAYGDPDYLGKANEECLVVVLIEETQAVAQLDQILAVDGIDIFFVAPGDLAQSMGYLGLPGHPTVQEVVRRALGQIVAAGRCAGALGNEETLATYLELGVRFFLTSYNSWITTGAHAYLANLARLSAR